MYVLKVNLAADGSAKIDKLEDNHQISSLFEPQSSVIDLMRDYSRKGWLVQVVAAQVKSFVAGEKLRA